MNDSIRETGYPDYKLISFCWDIVTSCQYRCSYCYALPWLTSPKKINNSQAYKSVLSRLEMGSMPEFLIEILGGEPLLHPKIDYILERLCSNKKCQSVTVNSNGTMPFDKLFYLRERGLKVSPSYHPEYNKHPKQFCTKVMKLKQHGFVRDQLQVNINIHNDKKYIDDYTYIVNFCAENDILVGANYLFCTPTYTCEYTDELFQTIKRKFEALPKIPDSWDMSTDRWIGVSKYRHPRAHSVRMVGGDGGEHNISLGEIRDRELNKWKGFNCRTKFWQIDSNGLIKNECTDEPLDMMNKNINSCIQCPNETCGVCEVQYNFHKTAPGEKPPAN